MSQVFISYAHVTPDRELAAQLQDILETEGFPVFVDSKIRLGQNWAEQIDLQLRDSAHFIALLSAASTQSDMVRREIAIAHKLRKANKLAILPVRLNFDEELPYELSAYLDLIQHVIWRPGESFERICRMVVETVRGSAPSLTPPAKSPSRQPFDQRELEVIAANLARHLGPVARLVVDEAARKAADWDQLYELLASEVPAGKERRMFQAARTHAAGRL